MNICNQLVKILASVFQVSTDIQMDVASGSMIIITVKRSMQKHLLLSLNAVKELVLDSLTDVLIKIHHSRNVDKLENRKQ